ncbi:MAG TPA: hypothetical protein VM756_13960 [Burkholderiales bacterium]|nr:hypothetical protein [Burkholderiales bacterium]
MAKITLATVKRFIKAHGANLQIATLSRFDGMIDCVSSCADTTFHPVKAPDLQGKPFVPVAGSPDHYLGIAGAWFVYGSRDHFSEYNEGGMIGIEVSNCCGRFVLAVPAAPASWPTTKQEDAEARLASAIGKAFDLAMQPTQLVLE